ncbi:Uncharacterised protein [Klebsiella pneumoniae]|nr:Uncharacterised protein [Klebsiella pneumoniae]
MCLECVKMSSSASYFSIFFITKTNEFTFCLNNKVNMVFTFVFNNQSPVRIVSP